MYFSRKVHCVNIVGRLELLDQPFLNSTEAEVESRNTMDPKVKRDSQPGFRTFSREGEVSVTFIITILL